MKKKKKPKSKRSQRRENERRTRSTKPFTMPWNPETGMEAGFQRCEVEAPEISRNEINFHCGFDKGALALEVRGEWESDCVRLRMTMGEEPEITLNGKEVVWGEGHGPGSHVAGIVQNREGNHTHIEFLTKNQGELLMAGVRAFEDSIERLIPG